MTDYLPLIGVIIGGLIGFVSALYVGSKRQNYELKKEAYYAYIKLDRTQTPSAPSILDRDFFFAENSIELWGSNEVKNLVKKVSEEKTWRKTSDFSKHIKDEFLPAIKGELSPHWWKLR